MVKLFKTVTEAQNGDISAYGDIVSRFKNMAFAYAYSRIRDFHRAEDIVQDSFIEAFSRLKTLRFQQGFASWFKLIVHKHCDRSWRAKKAGGDSSMIETIPDREDFPKELEVKDAVLAGLQSLPVKYRTVVSMFYMEEHTQDEIAAFLNLPLSTIKKRLHDGKLKMKEHLMDDINTSLRPHALDERFSKKVIAELRSRVNYLTQKKHPIECAKKLIIKALPGYKVIKAREVVDIKEAKNPWSLRFAYHAGKSKVLCTDLLDVVFGELRRQKTEMKIVTFGRLFYHKAPHMRNRSIVHGLSLLRVGKEVGKDEMESVVRQILEPFAGKAVIRYEKWEFDMFEPCYRVHMKSRNKEHVIAGCGILSNKALQDAGCNPKTMGGFAVNMVVEEVVDL